MKNIFETLREDHKTQRLLVNQLTDTSGDTQRRSDLFEGLKRELEAHALAEERYLYRCLMSDDSTIEKARHSVAEHKELDDLLEKLEATSPSSSAWLSTANHLKERLEHHLKEEEQEVFQLAGKVLSEEAKVTLAKSFEEEKRERVAEAI